MMKSVEELTGTHSAQTKGIFIAAGPDIDPSFGLKTVHSLDITPTLLYSLGLPIAEDFDGKARLRLFKPEFRAAHPSGDHSHLGQGPRGCHHALGDR